MYTVSIYLSKSKPNRCRMVHIWKLAENTICSKDLVWVDWLTYIYLLFWTHMCLACRGDGYFLELYIPLITCISPSGVPWQLYEEGDLVIDCTVHLCWVGLQVEGRSEASRGTTHQLIKSSPTLTPTLCLWKKYNLHAYLSNTYMNVDIQARNSPSRHADNYISRIGCVTLSWVLWVISWIPGRCSPLKLSKCP